MKLLKLLANASSVFKYLNILVHVANGLTIAAKALDLTIKELYTSNPQFKYLQTLESLLSFVNTAKDTISSFTGLFGLVPKAPAGDDICEELKKIENEIKQLS